ncbi:MAG: SufS family cysteine desulfurase [bacterium]
MPLDISQLRRSFPIFATQERRGRPLVYLDSAATTQKPQTVIDAITSFYRDDYGSVHRGIYELSARATQKYEHAREVVADFLGATTREVIFTRGATESINLVARAWGEANLKAGDEILLTELEHHSNLVPWQMLAQRSGAKLRFAGLTDDRRVDLADLKRKLSKRTKLVALTGMSNVTGDMPDLAAVTEAAHRVGARVLVDGAQLVPHCGFDVRAVDCDWLAFSGHKMLGPTGIGVLYQKEEIGEESPPWLGGGDMIEFVDYDSFTTNELPYKFEAGSPNAAGAIGLAAAIQFLNEIGWENIVAHERQLTEYALEHLHAVEGLVLYGPQNPERRGAVFSFNYQDLHSHDLATIVDADGIALRAGHHCAQPLMKKLGVGSTARVSFYLYNSQDEIDLLCGSLKRSRRFLSNAVG